MKTVVGLFDRYEEADAAVKALQEAGFKNESISAIAPERSVSEQLDDDPGEEVLKATGVGAAGGGILGGLAGLLLGIGALAIPGIGPAVAAGTIAAALGAAGSGAGIGAITGGMVGALVRIGLSKEDANVYAEGLKRGGVVVLVETEDDRYEIAENILERAGGVDVDTRQAQWIEDGWVHFDEQVYPPDQFPGGIGNR